MVKLLTIPSLLFFLIYLRGHQGKLWIETFQYSEISFHWRYVYNTFCLFHQTLLFFDYINSRPPNIRFTMEKEIDHNWYLLDVLINNDTHLPVTSVYYRKKTFTGPLTNYLGFTSLLQTGSHDPLVDRACKRKTSDLIRHDKKVK